MDFGFQKFALQSIAKVCRSFELDCRVLQRFASHLNLNASIVFAYAFSFQFCCLMYTCFIAEAVQETTEAVSSELLAEAV